MQHDAPDGDTQHLLSLGVYANKFHFRGLQNNGADNNRHFFDAEIAPESAPRSKLARLSLRARGCDLSN